MNLLFLLFFILIVALCTFISYKRGIIWTGIRVVLLGISALIAAAISSPITNSLVIKIFGDGKADTVTDVAVHFLEGANLGDLVNSLSIPLAGLTLSVATPFVFALLFIAGALITLILYLVTKAIIKKVCGAVILREIPLVHKITGGVVGCIVAIYSLAIIVSPICVPVETVDETGKADQLFQVAYHIIDFKEAQKPSPLGNIDILEKIETVKNIYSTLLHTPISGITKATLSYNFSKSIYDSLSTVERTSLTSGETTPSEYSLSSAINELIPLVLDTDDFLYTIENNSYLSLPVVLGAESLINKYVDITLLSSNEKLGLVNYCTDLLNKKIDSLILESYIPRLVKYQTFDAFRNDLVSYFDILKSIAELDLF